MVSLSAQRCGSSQRFPPQPPLHIGRWTVDARVSFTVTDVVNLSSRLYNHSLVCYIFLRNIPALLFILTIAHDAFASSCGTTSPHRGSTTQRRSFRPRL